MNDIRAEPDEGATVKNRARIIGLAVAGVAGTSGAAFAGMSVQDEPSSAQPIIEEASTTAADGQSADGTVTYQVGAAGTVAVTRTAGSLSVSSATAGAGWSVLAVSGPGGHVEVQFTDGLQLVTFAADAVGDDIAVSLTNVAAPGAETTTVALAPIDVQIISGGGDSGPGSTWAPAPQPATPAPTAPASSTPGATNPATTQPSPATTAAPSSGGDDDDEDDEDDEHEDDEDDEHEEERDDD